MKMFKFTHSEFTLDEIMEFPFEEIVEMLQPDTMTNTIRPDHVIRRLVKEVAELKKIVNKTN